MPAPPADRPSVAWLDLSAGVAGDMLLGALVDAGARLPDVEAAVEAVLPGTVTLAAEEVARAGLRATRVSVELLEPDQPHRTWTEIRDRITAADLSDRVRDDALAAFGRLAAAEARVHGTAVDAVHFHEVGAWDSVADVVGVCAALDSLGVAELVASPIALGSGRVRAAHGDLPVPGPAVLELVQGWPVEAGGAGELATPTGVALVTALSRPGPLPRLRVIAHGNGAGTRDTQDRANVVRVVVGTPEAPPGQATDLDHERLVVLEANVDDLDPRVWPAVVSGLLEAGARDAWLTPVVMKGGRPAVVVGVIAAAAATTALRDLLFDTTTTLGVRATEVDRWSLDRGWVDVDVAGERVAVKIAHRDGHVVHATPELRDAEAAATASGMPLREVLDRATAAAVAAGVSRGALLPDDIRPTERGAPQD